MSCVVNVEGITALRITAGLPISIAKRESLGGQSTATNIINSIEKLKIGPHTSGERR